MQTILIISQPDDYHAFAVAAGLRAKGISPDVWLSSDFPQVATEAIHFQEDQIDLDARNLDWRLPKSPTVVWNRRPAYVIDNTELHASDHEFAEMNCKLFRHAFFDLLAPEAFWINPGSAVRRFNKIHQIRIAQELELRVPPTLITNDPGKIRDFFFANDQEIIYKPLTAQSWRNGDTYWVPYTAKVEEEHLNNEKPLRSAPGIFQQMVPKEFEVRMTIMGSFAVAAKIFSQATKTTRIDWRKAPEGLKMEPLEPPGSLVISCKQLMARMGLVFGCFDFIVTPDQEYIFLEVNQMGQFLFLERFTGQPLLDSFCEFLISGRPDFIYPGESRSSTRVNLEDVRAEVPEQIEVLSQRHVAPNTGLWIE